MARPKKKLDDEAPVDPITVAQACEILGCSKQNVHYLMKEGKLPGYRTSEGIVVSREVAEALAEEKEGHVPGLAPQLLLPKKPKTDFHAVALAEKEDRRRDAELRLKQEELALRERELSIMRPAQKPPKSGLDLLDAALPVLILLAGAGVLAFEKYKEKKTEEK